MKGMTAVRVIFDGKAFIPQQPVSLPAQSEAMGIVDENDRSAQDRLDGEVRAYYESGGGGDAEDDAWGKATAPQSHRAWDTRAVSASK
jgi:hypothetical protein